MKKLIVLSAFVLATTFSLTSCGDKKTETESTETTTVDTVATPEGEAAVETTVDSTTEVTTDTIAEQK